MIGIEELKDSLRHQLSALIALYEADPDALEATRHGGNGTREAAVPPPMPDATIPDGAEGAHGTEGTADEAATAEPARGLDIETCLVAFDAAIHAAERAARARDALQRRAHEAMEHSIATRRAATGLRQDLQRMILACGRSLGLPGHDGENHRLGELRLALRRGDADARHADREASTARRRAELAIAAASAALLAAVQADPARGNTAFDPATARAARAVAERAAEQAESSLADAQSAAVDGARVIAFGRAAGFASGRSGE